jgi:hypothetical protein
MWYISLKKDLCSEEWNLGKTLCGDRISWNSDQASRLEEKRMLRVQKGSQNILEIKRKKFWMLQMWYITLKKDLWSEECVTNGLQW